ncbi:facilitated trehalose transporter Tret1 [Diabrotica virgifera virgifera]|uniref:Major facilitator superfamily (MFS) profile domain-containing protein n=1 Tax=Diabrotica virgifera virgifera TaxID=50390 RepID=A0ABM5IXX9_DIAVI|nr:facilitated trehalose transporter Tret1 [Diabrotica virgifera virgifera]
MTVTPGFTNMFKGTLPQISAVLAGTLCALSDGMHYGWTAPAIPILMSPGSPIPITKHQGEWLENVYVIGAAIGLWPTMYAVDKIGRKKSILLACFVSALVWITIALAPSVEYIFVARGFAGAAGNMAFVATPMYIAEIADQKIRGFLSSLIYLMMLCGILLIYCIAPFFPIYVPCILGAVMVSIELIWFSLVPNSPYYLIIKNQIEAARHSLKRLRQNDSGVEEELKQIKLAVDRQRTERARFLDLFLIASNRKALLIMVVLNYAQHFSSVSVLLMNMHIILEQAGSIYMDPHTTAIVFSLIMLIAALTGSLIIDKFGRKILIISSGISTAFCLLTIAIYFTLKNYGFNTTRFSWIPIACVMVYAFTFKFGLGMVPIVITAEIFPTTVKAYGMALADGSYVTASLLSLQVYQRLTDSFGLQYPFYIFTACCFSTIFFTYFVIPETKGKTLDEIQLILKGEFNKSKSEKV